MTAETQPNANELNTIDVNKYNATLEQNQSLLQQMETMASELDKFKQKHAEAERHRKQQEIEARKKADEAARNAGDVEAIEQSWNEKYGALKNETAQTIEQLNNVIQNVTVGAEARSIASELAIEGSANVLIPHIESRLSMELINGTPTIKVLQNGKPSALTIEDLKAEIAENKAFAPIIRGISASGTGSVGGANSDKNTMKRGQFEALSHTEKARFVREGGKVLD